MTALEFYNRFDKMTPVLNSFAYNLTKSMEDVKDLYQETAFRALTNREKFRAGTNFKAWLFTIMKNIFINNYRKNVKKRKAESTFFGFFLYSLMKTPQVPLQKLERKHVQQRREYQNGFGSARRLMASFCLVQWYWKMLTTLNP